MGLYSFNKNSGVKLIDFDKTEGVANDLELNEALARKLEASINDLCIQVEELKINVVEDIVSVSGLVCDIATKNKVILIIGGTFGISTVNDQIIVEDQEISAQFHMVSSADSLVEN